MTKKNPPKQIADLAHGLSCLVANMKFSPGDAVAIADALTELMAAVSRSKDLEKRVRQLEEKASKPKATPVALVREAG